MGSYPIFLVYNGRRHIYFICYFSKQKQEKYAFIVLLIKSSVKLLEKTRRIKNIPKTPQIQSPVFVGSNRWLYVNNWKTGLH